MTDTKTFDLIIIGTGVAASTVAWKCHSAGWRIAVIDSRPFGGTCVLRGCDPKKVLVGAAEVIDWNRRMESKGIVDSDKVKLHWPDLMRFKRSFTEPIPKEREEQFSKAGIVAFHGRARFIDERTVIVDNTHTLNGRHIVLATGAEPMKLNIPGEDNIRKSDQFLELNGLPSRFVFVGGGYISFEFAHIAARAGANVTILHRGARPLDNFDPYLVEMLLQRTRELGIDVRLQTKVEAIESSKVNNNNNIGFIVYASNTNDGGNYKIEGDMVVHGAGRVPEIDDLDLGVGGVERENKKGVKVNEYLQSVSNPLVYAAGDAAASGGLPLTPVATYEGEIVAANLLEGNHVKPNYEGVPSVVFTIPPLASVGLQEEAARKQGLHFRINKANTAAWYTSRRVGENYSGFKVLIEDDTDRILGAHILGPHAEEAINIFAIAIRFGLKAGDIKQAIFSYPTTTSDLSYML
ncbi:MAG TPA: NAD(P)/FAD-dependent oxidoreductase [Methylomirabilota bacterium]|nr:NAD(P)/FAD-dependent oxidoreductase [Methylomirabilota bacterium]